MKEKWHNDNSYIKRIASADNENIEAWDKSLYSLKNIKKGELIATFATDEITMDKHYFRHSQQPNCNVVDRHVFANVDIPSETELTIYYHGVLL